MNIEQLKELAVSVEDRMPEENKPVVVIFVGELYTTIITMEINGDTGCWEGSDDCEYGISDRRITHWIDFDLLTTKAKAYDMVKSSYAEGFDRRGLTNFLDQNKDRL
jgi:hypothetical protein